MGVRAKERRGVGHLPHGSMAGERAGGPFAGAKRRMPGKLEQSGCLAGLLRSCLVLAQSYP